MVSPDQESKSRIRNDSYYELPPNGCNAVTGHLRLKATDTNPNLRVLQCFFPKTEMKRGERRGRREDHRATGISLGPLHFNPSEIFSRREGFPFRVFRVFRGLSTKHAKYTKEEVFVLFVPFVAKRLRIRTNRSATKVTKDTKKKRTK